MAGKSARPSGSSTARRKPRFHLRPGWMPKNALKSKREPFSPKNAKLSNALGLPGRVSVQAMWYYMPVENSWHRSAIIMAKKGAL